MSYRSPGRPDRPPRVRDPVAEPGHRVLPGVHPPAIRANRSPSHTSRLLMKREMATAQFNVGMVLEGGDDRIQIELEQPQQVGVLDVPRETTR
jgi:hypothetical protein